MRDQVIELYKQGIDSILIRKSYQPALTERFDHKISRVFKLKARHFFLLSVLKSLRGIYAFKYEVLRST